MKNKKRNSINTRSYDEFKKEWNEKYPNKDKFENWTNTLSKEELELVDQYIKAMQSKNKEYLDQVKKACKKSYSVENLKKNIKNIRK